jgi:Domain of Unknown Function with PDB structure (DUF3857)
MRKQSLILAAGFAVSLLPLCAQAQFQQPDPAELHMTSDPKAPGADAVYLEINETANDEMHMMTVYARIKVLTEKGKDLATVRIPYSDLFWVSSIKARTIHPDGTIVPLEEKPADLKIEKSSSGEYGRKYFNFPSVDVGSVLEYQYEIETGRDVRDSSFRQLYFSPQWDIQRKYFVHKAHYAFSPFSGFLKGAMNQTYSYLTNHRGEKLDTLIWWAYLPPGDTVKVDAAGRYSIDVTDVPPAPNEDWMPPTQSVLYKVFFYYKSSSTTKEFWDKEAAYWNSDVNRFISPTQTIRDAVAGIVSPGDSDMVKAKKLYDAVQALDNTDYSRQKTASERQELKLKDVKRAEDVWKQKSGNSEDIALLYLSMLRAASLESYAMKVVDRDRALFDPTYLSTSQFDDTVVLLDSGGQEIVLDPGEKMCPFQTVSWRHSGAGGMRQTASGATFAKTPDPDFRGNSILRSGNVTLDQRGAVSGEITIAMTGQEALRWRQSALRNDEAELKKSFDAELQGEVPAGVEAHVDRFVNLDHPDGSLAAVVKISGAMGAATGKRLLLPAFFFASRAREPFVQEASRQEPVDMHYGDRVTDQITYHLPPSMTLEGAPQDASQMWPGHALYVAKTKPAPGQVLVARSVARAFAVLQPSDYQRLRDFYVKVAAGDQQQLVLRNAQEANGN